MKRLSEYITDRNFLSDTRNTRNFCDLVDINETSAKRMIDAHTQNGYIIISPCRGMEAMLKSGEIKDFGDIYSQKQRDEFNRANKERVRSLIYEIKKAGVSYTPVFGGFIENKGTDKEETVFERSFVVYNQDKNGKRTDFNNLYDFGLRMCKAYEQDSFLVQYPDGGRLAYVTKDGETDLDFSGKASFNDFSKMYFTDLHRYNSPRQDSRLTRVTFESAISGVYVNPRPQCYSESHVRWMDGEVFIGS